MDTEELQDGKGEAEREHEDQSCDELDNNLAPCVLLEKVTRYNETEVGMVLLLSSTIAVQGSIVGFSNIIIIL